MGAPGAQRPARVIYVSMQMPDPTWKGLFAHAPFPPSQAAQKYHGLMARGLALSGAEVIAVTPPPVSRTTSKRRFLCLKGERWEGVTYRYLPIVDLPLLRRGLIWLTSFFTTLFALADNAYVLCDALIVAASGGARAAAKLRRRPCAAIVTDVPALLGNNSPVARLNMRELTRYDGYVLLTKAMNDLVNPHKRPYLVAEGLADGAMARRPNLLCDKLPEKTVLYAGMLHAKYGILNLVEGFALVQDPAARLVIYGTGDSTEAIRAAAKADHRIDYRGVADNAQVVAEELRATLLVNPRPTKEAFVKYSFPSKNLEYMASGTPLLTTPLPGMPPEYDRYVYLFDGETPQAMGATLARLLALPRETLHEKGTAARSFVLTNKNNAREAGRILAFMEALT